MPSAIQFPPVALSDSGLLTWWELDPLTNVGMSSLTRVEKCWPREPRQADGTLRRAIRAYKVQTDRWAVIGREECNLIRGMLGIKKHDYEPWIVLSSERLARVEAKLYLPTMFIERFIPVFDPPCGESAWRPASYGE